MGNIIPFQPKEPSYIVDVDNQVLRFEDIDKLFMNGDLKFCELAKFFVKCPLFHEWFLKKHRQAFL